MKYFYDGYWFDVYCKAVEAVFEMHPYKDADGIAKEIAKIEEYSEEKLARLDLNTKEG